MSHLFWLEDHETLHEQHRSDFPHRAQSFSDRRPWNEVTPPLSSMSMAGGSVPMLLLPEFSIRPRTAIGRRVPASVFFAKRLYTWQSMFLREFAAVRPTHRAGCLPLRRHTHKIRISAGSL
jgi:hypothetical protein